MSTSTSKRKKRLYSSLSCPSSPSLTSSRSPPSDDSDEDRPSKKLALSLNRLSLSNTPEPKEKEIEMRQRKSYQKDAFTTVIESLSTTDSDQSDDNLPDETSKATGVSEGSVEGMGEAPFSRDEAHVTILSEIEKRLTKLPHKLLRADKDDEGKARETALVLYRSPESMGLPVSERHKSEDMKALTRKRIIERRRRQRNGEVEGDGYEADVEDFPSQAPLLHVNGAHHGSTHGIAGTGFGGNIGYQVQMGHVNSYGAPISEDLEDEVPDEDDMDGEMMQLD